MKILFRRSGNALQLKWLNDQNQIVDIPIEIATKARLAFKYNLKTAVPSRRGLQFEYHPVYMVQYQNGGLLTSYGLLDSLKAWFKQQGIEAAFQELTPEDKNSLLLKPDWSVLQNYQLRNRQEECLKAIVERKHGIIDAPVGFGKTFLMGVLTQLYPKAKFHVITKSVAIANRIYKDLLRITSDVGMIGGGKNITGKRITVITADSLKKSDGDADFLIWDEAHQAAASTYSALLLRIYRYSRNYGFTATPTGRSDGSDPVLKMLFGDTIFEMKYDEAKDRGLVVPVSVRWLTCSDVLPTALNYTNRVSLERHAIWRNRSRNQMIADDVRKISNDESVLILVGKVEHAVNLAKELPEFTLVYGSMSEEDCEWYKRQKLLPEDYRPINAREREELKEAFRDGRIKKVIATDVWNTGVDFPDLRYVYNVSARGSSILTTQGAGRVSRIASGKFNGTVIDIVDDFPDNGHCFYTSAVKRYKKYTELGWKQEGFSGGKIKGSRG